MQRGNPILDGLLYCLRPSYSPALLSRARVLPPSRKRIPRPNTASPQRRANSTEHGPNHNSHGRSNTKAPNVNTQQTEKPTNQSRRTEIPSQKYDKSLRRKPSRSKKTYPGVPWTLERETTENLETLLHETTTKWPSIVSATQILRCLIRDRHVRPEVRHYRALILANTDAERGSPDGVRRLLLEMQRYRIPADSGTLHAVLQVLAVHPDYLLRQQVVDTLRDRWLPLSPAGWHWVVASLVRQYQFELALDHIAVMNTKSIPVEGWLHSLLVYNLCDFGEHDEVLELMRSRVYQHYDMTSDLWMYVLDVASEALHHELASFVWKHRVELDYLYPSHRVCSNVLRLASCRGDTELAVSVCRFLMEKGSSLSLEDYEKMVELYVMHSDLLNAFEILCSMCSAGIAVKDRSTRPISEFMMRNNANPRETWAILKELKTAKNREIPTHLATLVIQYCEHVAVYDESFVDDGIAIYKDLKTICPDVADTPTLYNALINMGRRGQQPKAAMFAAKEMARLGVVPNGKTYEHLILACLDAKNYRSAYLYFEDMTGGWNYAVSEEGRFEIRGILAGSSGSVRINDDFAKKLYIQTGVEKEQS